MPPKSPRAEMKSQKPKPESKEKSQAELRDVFEKKFRALKPILDDAFTEYQSALNDDTFEDADGEPSGSGEARKLSMEQKFERLVERIIGMKKMLDSGEPLPEGLNDEDAKALSTYITSWRSSPEATTIPTLIDPTTQDYPALAQDIDAAKFGEYTLNPETQGIDFESAKVFIPDLSQFEAKTGPPAKPAAKLAEVARYVMDTYGDTHHVPGIEYWKWLIEHPGETPQNLKDGKFYFFPGSVLRDEDGRWRVPRADWSGSGWYRSASWLANAWSSGYRVVLLEK